MCIFLATAQGTKEIDPPPLSYKKWVLRGQEKITTHLNVGIMSPTPFDQMQSACIHDGFNADVKSGSAAIYQYAAGGTTPFMGFYYATEVSGKIFDDSVSVEMTLTKKLFHKQKLTLLVVLWDSFVVEQWLPNSSELEPTIYYHSLRQPT